MLEQPVKKSSEKSLYAIGDLSTTSSKSVFPVQENYPGSNSLAYL